MAVTKIRNLLTEEARQRGWSITLSIGVLTCMAAPPTTDELVKMADGLMYSVKSSGKDAIKYSIYEG